MFRRLTFVVLAFTEEQIARLDESTAAPVDSAIEEPAEVSTPIPVPVQPTPTPEEAQEDSEKSLGALAKEFGVERGLVEALAQRLAIAA
jgi:hypothetical protein